MTVAINKKRNTFINARNLIIYIVLYNNFDK